MIRTFSLLIIFILFNFANYGESYSLRGKKYWEMGGTLGTPGGFNFKYAGKLNDYLITGFSLGTVLLGYGLESYTLIPIEDNTEFRICLGVQTGYINMLGSWYWYSGITGDILWKCLYTKVDLNVGRSNTFSPVQIGFQIGLVFRNYGGIDFRKKQEEKEIKYDLY